MKVGRVFPMMAFDTLRLAVHVNGDPREPSKALSPPIKTRRGWCYFRLASKTEITVHLRALDESEDRQRQFAAERAALAVT